MKVLQFKTEVLLEEQFSLHAVIVKHHVGGARTRTNR